MISEVAFVTEADETVAEAIAAELGIACVRWQEATGLCLLVAHGKKGLARADSPPLPAGCEWGDAPHKIRLGKPSAKDMLAKSCLVTGRRKPVILDATGGFGRDAWLLAGWGAQLRVYERQPAMAWLLKDALVHNPMPNLHLLATDFLTAAAELEADSCDLVYLDPQFPTPAKRKAKSQKRMDLLQSLLPSPEPELLPLLRAALRLARYRVVLKRPRHAAIIKAPQLFAQLDMNLGLFHRSGASSRFDIYTKRSWSAAPAQHRQASQAPG